MHHACIQPTQVLREYDQWLLVQKDSGERGVVPSNYTARLPADTATQQTTANATTATNATAATTTPTATTPGGTRVLFRARAQHDYTASAGSALAFRRDDVLAVLRDDVPGGWWLAELDGRVGHVPPSYLTRLQHSPTPSTTAPEIPASPVEAPQQQVSNDTPSATVTTTATPTETGTSPATTQEQGKETGTSGGLAREDPEGRMPACPFAAVALHAYAARKATELSIAKGDGVTVEGYARKGWVAARNAAGARGYVPQHYIAPAPPAAAEAGAGEEPVSPATDAPTPAGAAGAAAELQGNNANPAEEKPQPPPQPSEDTATTTTTTMTAAIMEMATAAMEMAKAAKAEAEAAKKEAEAAKKECAALREEAARREEAHAEEVAALRKAHAEDAAALRAALDAVQAAAGARADALEGRLAQQEAHYTALVARPGVAPADVAALQERAAGLERAAREHTALQHALEKQLVRVTAQFDALHAECARLLRAQPPAPDTAATEGLQDLTQ